MEKIFGAIGLLYISAIAAGVLGYVLNLVHFVQNIDAFNGKEIFRLVGLVVPFVGAVLGYAI
jgi:hypothetical protein